LPAAVIAGPEFTEMETTLAGGYVTVHSMADGSLPAGEVKVKLKATLPFEPAVPDERAKESGPVCPKEARADSREAIAAINAIWLRVEGLFIGSHVSSISPVLNDVTIATDNSRDFNIRAQGRPSLKNKLGCSSRYNRNYTTSLCRLLLKNELVDFAVTNTVSYSERTARKHPIL